MPQDERQRYELIRKELFSKEQANRLAAVSKVATLPPELALPLNEEGLNHWDRLLRKSCSWVILTWSC